MMDSPAVLVLLFAVAAAAGTAARFLITGYLNSDFPLGTLAVNVAASFAIGIVVSLDDPMPTILGIGALGALSTWSVTATEVADMSRSGRAGLGIGYLGLTVSTGVLAAWFGLKLGQLLI